MDTRWNSNQHSWLGLLKKDYANSNNEERERRRRRKGGGGGGGGWWGSAVLTCCCTNQSGALCPLATATSCVPVISPPSWNHMPVFGQFSTMTGRSLWYTYLRTPVIA